MLSEDKEKKILLFFFKKSVDKLPALWYYIIRKGKENKRMFEEMMRYGATLEELCEEAGITVEELLGEE